MLRRRDCSGAARRRHGRRASWDGALARELSDDVLELEGADHGLATGRAPAQIVARSIAAVPTLSACKRHSTSRTRSRRSSRASATACSMRSASACDCTIRLRGNQLTLEGDERSVTEARAVVDELVELVEGGHEIGPHTVDAVLGALDAGRRTSARCSRTSSGATAARRSRRRR